MKALRWPSTIIGLFLFILVGAQRIPACISYEQDIGGHLKRAADANTVPLAVQEMQTAVDSIHRWGLCTERDRNFRGADKAHDCYTSIFYRTPDDDVLFWRQNLEAALEDLKSLPAEADRLLVSNTLMKLRETILDEGSKGASVTAPEGITIYPKNTGLFWTFLFGCIFGGLGILGWLFWWDNW